LSLAQAGDFKGATIQVSKLHWTFTILSVVSVVYGLGDRVKAQEFTGDPELLKLVAGQSRVNVESLLTWRGRLNVVENRSEASGEERRYKSKVDFAYDRKLNAKRWRWNCHDFSIIKDGKESLAEIGLMSGMLKDNAFYRLGPVPNSDKGRKVATQERLNRVRTW
jgi:hypothetical protein